MASTKTKNFIAICQSTRPMRDTDQCKAEGSQVIVDFTFHFHINMGGALVDKQDLGVTIQSPCKQHPLLLTT